MWAIDSRSANDRQKVFQWQWNNQEGLFLGIEVKYHRQQSRDETHQEFGINFSFPEHSEELLQQVNELNDYKKIYFYLKIIKMMVNGYGGNYDIAGVQIVPINGFTAKLW